MSPSIRFYNEICSAAEGANRRWRVVAASCHFEDIPELSQHRQNPYSKSCLGNKDEFAHQSEQVKAQTADVHKDPLYDCQNRHYDI